MVSRNIRVLIVEDCADDAYLVERQLRRHGFAPVSERVEDAAGMRAALASGHFDLIISDYLMPEFSAVGALKIYRESGLDIPFLVVSGSIGEDAAVEAMRHGVHDYLMKDALARLGAAVERELEQAKHRRERRHVMDTLSSRVSELLDGIRTSQNLEDSRALADEALRLVRELGNLGKEGTAAGS